MLLTLVVTNQEFQTNTQCPWQTQSQVENNVSRNNCEL